MSENLALAILLAALLAVGALYIAMKAYGWKVAALTIAAPFWLGWKTLRFSAFVGSRAVIGARRRRVKDPESAELVEREVINPPRLPKIQTLDHDSHNTPAGLIKAVHKVTLAESGAAKGQTGINYDIQFALQYSPENLLILEVKPDKDLSNVVYAHARPQDRIWEYTLQPGDEYSSSLNLASDLSQLKDVARQISHEKNSKDPHWNDKCATLIPSAGIALSDPDTYSSTGQLTATLNDIRDAIIDRRWLWELQDDHPVVDNVADAENEWSYIRSTATKHLDALSEMRLRRVFAGGVGVMVGGFIEDQRSEETLEFVKSAKEEQLADLREHRAETDVCMAEAEARAKPDDGMFAVITDPKLDQCYAEQEVKVAEINAEAGD